mgnify:FL=1
MYLVFTRYTPPNARRIVLRQLFAFQHIYACSGDVNQLFLQLLIVFQLLAAAALRIGIHQFVVGNILFIAAIAPAVPDDGAGFRPSRCWIQRGQVMKLAPGNIGKRIFLMLRISAVGFAPCDKKRSAHIAFSSAIAPAVPLHAAGFFRRIIAFPQNRKRAETPAPQISAFIRPFFEFADQSARSVPPDIRADCNGFTVFPVFPASQRYGYPAGCRLPRAVPAAAHCPPESPL